VMEGSLNRMKSLLRCGFLNPLSPVAMGPKKEAPGMAPPPPVPTARVPAAVGGLPRLEVSPKPLQRYSRKLRGSRFLKMDDRMIAEAVSSFSVPLASSRVVTGLVDPSSKLLDSEEEDDDFWGVEDEVCWGGDEEDGDPYLLDWDSMGESSEVTLEATP
jgi:hypothetical protein